MAGIPKTPPKRLNGIHGRPSGQRFVALDKALLKKIIEKPQSFLGKFVFDEQNHKLLVNHSVQQEAFPDTPQLRGFFNVVELVSRMRGVQIQLIPKNPKDLDKLKVVRDAVVRWLGELDYNFAVNNSPRVSILINILRI
jgi:hypothetical protein